MNIYEWIFTFPFVFQTLASRYLSVLFIIWVEASPSTNSLTFTNLHFHSFLREFSPSRFAPSEISWQSKWRCAVGIYNYCLFHLYCLFLFWDSVLADAFFLGGDFTVQIGSWPFFFCFCLFSFKFTPGKTQSRLLNHFIKVWLNLQLWRYDLFCLTRKKTRFISKN